MNASAQCRPYASRSSWPHVVPWVGPTVAHKETKEIFSLFPLQKNMGVVMQCRSSQESYTNAMTCSNNSTTEQLIISKGMMVTSFRQSSSWRSLHDKTTSFVENSIEAGTLFRENGGLHAMGRSHACSHAVCQSPTFHRLLLPSLLLFSAMRSALTLNCPSLGAHTLKILV